jgi:hypothetical protein
MAHALIPVYEAEADTQIEGLGSIGVGAQMAISAGIALTSVAVGGLFQMKMAKDARKDAQSLADKQEARARELEKKADAERLRQEQIMAEQATYERERAEKMDKVKRGAVIGGSVILGLGAVAAVVGYFVFRK